MKTLSIEKLWEKSEKRKDYNIEKEAKNIKKSALYAGGIEMSERTVICPKCKRSKVEKCPVCNGSCRDPRDRSKECSYCGGIGYVPCNTCNGEGEVPISIFNSMTY